MKLKGIQAQPWSTVYLQIDLKNATITFEDGTGTPNTLDITIGEGNLVWTEARNIEYVLDRGLLDEVREGDQIPVELTIDILWEFLTAVVSTAGIPSPEDFLKKRGNASGFISSDADVCRPYAIDIIVLHDPPCGGIEKETITFSDFRYDSIPHDLRAGTFVVSGSCNITEPTVVRSANPT